MGECHEIFYLCFFSSSQNTLPGPLLNEHANSVLRFLRIVRLLSYSLFRIAFLFTNRNDYKTHGSLQFLGIIELLSYFLFRIAFLFTNRNDYKTHGSSQFLLTERCPGPHHLAWPTSVQI